MKNSEEYEKGKVFEIKASLDTKLNTKRMVLKHRQGK